jgi:hypothetical protein
MRAPLAASMGVLAALATALPVSAQPMPPAPVALTAEGVFGNESLLGDGYSALTITATNTTSSTLRGHVEVVIRQWQQPEHAEELPLDLPGGETRRAVVTIFVSDSAEISVRYVADGRVVGVTSLSPAYGSGAEALVVLADPPRIRGALLDLQTTVVTPTTGYAGGGPQASGVPLGVVAFDARTGDPILPDSALGWASVGVLVVSAPALARVPERQLSALRGWLHSGGRLLVFPRTDADLALPFVREHLGTITRSTTQVMIDALPPIPGLECPTGTLAESFGCSARAGFGAIYIASFDGTAPPYVDTPSTRAVVEAIVNASNAALDPVRPSLPFAEHTDDMSDGNTYYGSAQQASFGRLRAALDPNEGYRPALALIAVVLFLYVLLVGPLNFWWVQRRKTPTYALVTTPALALACVVVMFMVGYLGKGVLMRYRRVEIVEAVAGDDTGLARRYTGLYATRPTTIEIPGPEQGGIMRIAGGSGGLVRAGDEHATLEDVRAGLWETVFTREDRTLPLGEGISFDVDGARLANVVNRSALDLHNAFVIDGMGQVFLVGDIAAGATAPIARDSTYFVAAGSTFYDASSLEVGTLRDALGLTRDDDAYVLGIARLLGSQLVTGYLPVLYARAETDAEPASSPSFARESDLRILRVVPAYTQSTTYVIGGGIHDVPVNPPSAPTDPMGAALDSLFGGGGAR